MSITRLFRVVIHPEFRTDFEDNFASLSVKTVTGADGFISVSIHKPTEWTPDEYVMITEWKNEAALIAFVGKQWNQAVIPVGMERFVNECWVDHYQSWNQP